MNLSDLLSGPDLPDSLMSAAGSTLPIETLSAVSTFDMGHALVPDTSGTRPVPASLAGKAVEAASSAGIATLGALHSAGYKVAGATGATAALPLALVALAAGLYFAFTAGGGKHFTRKAAHGFKF